MNRYLKLGLSVLRRQTQLVFVVVLIIIFPIIFIYSFNYLAETNHLNNRTLVLQQINSLHDTFVALMVNKTDLSNISTDIKNKDSNLKKIRIVKETDTGLLIIVDSDNSKVGQFEENSSLYKSALIGENQTYLFEFIINNERITQAFRAFRMNDNEIFYVFTEHDYTKLYSLIDSRLQKSYLILSFIFIFIIALAYWIARQINYERKFLDTKNILKERDLFFDGLVHEFRAPLTAVNGYSSLIEESTNLDEESKSYAKRIKEASGRLVVLINDFLEVSRIQSGKIKSNIQIFNVVKNVEKVVAEMKPLADLKKLNLNIQAPMEPVLIKSDSLRLEQILTNLINNAIKYTDKGEVSVIIESNNLQTTITIADTGGGISADDQRKLFAPFVRVGSYEQNQNVVGSGLGMWIIKQLAEQLQGEISLESIKGVGTHVILKLKNNLK